MTRLRAFLLWLSDCWSPHVRLPEPYETLPGPQADAEMLRRDTATVGENMAVAFERATGAALTSCRTCAGRIWYWSVFGGLYCTGCGTPAPSAAREEAPQQ